MKLYSEKTFIINAFLNKYILPGDVEKNVYYWDEELKPEFEESIAERTKIRRQNREGQGLTIVTPEQMLSRLPITLAQLKAGNNLEKL